MCGSQTTHVEIRNFFLGGGGALRGGKYTKLFTKRCNQSKYKYLVTRSTCMYAKVLQKRQGQMRHTISPEEPLHRHFQRIYR